MDRDSRKNPSHEASSSVGNSSDGVRNFAALTGTDGGVTVSHPMQPPEVVILDDDDDEDGQEGLGRSDPSVIQQPSGEEINLETVKREIEEAPTDNLIREKEKEATQEEEKPMELSSDDDEPEIIGVRKVINTPKSMPLVSYVAWRTRQSRGEQDRVSYSTYFQKISDDSSEEKDDKADKDAMEEGEEEEESSDSGSDLSKSEPDLDEDMLFGDWGERNHLTKRKYVKQEIEDDSGFDFLDLTPERLGKKLKTDNPDEVHVIESDPEADLGSNREVLRSASSDSDWEQEMKYTPSNAVGSGTSNLSRSYRSRTGTERSRSYSHSYNKSAKYYASSSRNRSSPQKRFSKKNYQNYKGPKGKELMSLLVDKMCGDKDSDVPFDPNRYGLTDELPLVFTWETSSEEEKEVDEEEEEWERHMDVLWADFDFALRSENIGKYNQEEDVCSSAVQEGDCEHGHHDLYLDEQVGLICTKCHLVTTEIRHILPPFAATVEKSARRSFANDPKAQLTYGEFSDEKEEENQETNSRFTTIDGTIWDLIPGIINTMYSHQQEAIEFMWNNLAGGVELDHLRKGPHADVIGGCVVCHAPGTGKTRLAIVFIQTYIKVFPDCRPVIIAPSGMLYTWEEEFKKWNVNVPFHILNNAEFTGKEDSAMRKLVRNESRSEKLTRLVKLYSWDKGNSILGVSYGLFKKLTSDKYKTEEDLKIRNFLLEKPGLLVLDEGHTPRNEKSIIWKTLGKVKSEKRIILSGTPFQNNFLELYNILSLVRPQFAQRFLVKKPKKRGRGREREEQEAKGIWASITSNVTDDNAEQVRSILKPFVHIHNGNILQTLPGLRECVVVLNPTSYQEELIKTMLAIGTGCNFENEYKISLASTHPSLVTAVNMTEEEAKNIDTEKLEKLRPNPNEGVKTKFVMEVVRLCEVLKEKVLIFSQYIEPLKLIKSHLIKTFKWSEDKEILQMDGKISPKNRQASIDVFNNRDSEVKVLLASTRACCEGISLTGASRVVLLDVVWNPAVGRQAISRAYRIGQEKFVYTYNLVTCGTSEVGKYDRQAVKDHLSKLVFSHETDLNNVRNTLTKAEEEQSDALVSEDRVLSTMSSHSQLSGMFEKIYYPPTDANVVYTYNQAASLLI